MNGWQKVRLLQARRTPSKKGRNLKKKRDLVNLFRRLSRTFVKGRLWMRFKGELPNVVNWKGCGPTEKPEDDQSVGSP